mgnify:CR=1 FL=1
MVFRLWGTSNVTKLPSWKLTIQREIITKMPLKTGLLPMDGHGLTITWLVITERRVEHFSWMRSFCHHLESDQWMTLWRNRRKNRPRHKKPAKSCSNRRQESLKALSKRYWSVFSLSFQLIFIVFWYLGRGNQGSQRRAAEQAQRVYGEASSAGRREATRTN